MFCFSMAVYHYGLFSNPEAAQGNWWLRVALGLLTWIWVGYLYGRSCWNRNERAFVVQRADSATSGPDT
jgi:hypothetical protein